MADLEAFTRQRIDYQRLPNGGLRAVLTVTLPDGLTRSYAADLVSGSLEVGADDSYRPEFDPLGTKKFRVYDLAQKPNQKRLTDAAYTYFAHFGFNAQHPPPKAVLDAYIKRHVHQGNAAGVLKGIVSVVKVVAPLALNFVVPGSGFIATAALIAKKALPTAKKVLNSDLMAHAALELAKEAKITAAPVTRTAALTAASVLGVGAGLAKAQQYIDAGKPELGKFAAQQALLNARRVTHSPESAAKLMRLANEKRLAAEALAHNLTPAAAKRLRAKKKRAPTQSVDVLQAARAGIVRSNKGGRVSESDLVRAARSGRVFWVNS